MFKSKIICILSVILAIFSISMIASVSAKEENPEKIQQTTTSETTTHIEVEVQTIYNVPLSDELQIYTQQVCKEYKVPFDLVIGVMFAESTFNPNAKNGDCYGLMQVNTINAEELKNIGVYDLTDAKQNIKSGVYLLSKALRKYDISEALIAYNWGESGAKEKLNNGITSTDYTRKVLRYAAGLEVKERIYTVIDTKKIMC